MEIDIKLKRNLIADVENIALTHKMSDEVKESLMRCFEITIGTHFKQLNITGDGKRPQESSSDCVLPVVVFSEAELKAKLDEQKEEYRQWLEDEGYELLAERL